jgi:hypothetical protein
MTQTDAGASGRNARRRAVLAVVASPLVFVIFTALGLWNNVASGQESLAEGMTSTVLMGIVDAYLVGVPAGLLTLLLLRVFNLPKLAWAVIPTYLAGFFVAAAVVVGLASGGVRSGVLGATALFGGPLSVAFCLLLGVRWRR